jgi:hypothetical protein
MSQAKNTRREIIGAGAAVAAIAAVGLPMGATLAKREVSLAALIARYFDEVHTFNATTHQTDAESNAHAAATYTATLRKIVGVPARTSDDAAAALNWLIKENIDFETEYHGYGLFGRVVTSLVDALKGYIVSTGRLA